jgi:hypothetical protein
MANHHIAAVRIWSKMIWDLGAGVRSGDALYIDNGHSRGPAWRGTSHGNLDPASIALLWLGEPECWMNTL